MFPSVVFMSYPFLSAFPTSQRSHSSVLPFRKVEHLPTKKRVGFHLQEPPLKVTFKVPKNGGRAPTHHPFPRSSSGGRTPVPRLHGARTAPRRAAEGCWAAGCDCWAAGCEDSCCDPPLSPNFGRWCGGITHPRIRLASRGSEGKIR